MKTSKVVPEDLSASVVAVPPLARNRDLGLDRQQNLKLIRHLEAGGVTTLMYGGNANFHNVAVSEYAEMGPLLPMLHGSDGADEAPVREAALRLLAVDRATDAAAA
jgi:hypothetical protein